MALRQAQGKTLGSVRVEMAGDTIDSATTYEPYGKLLAHSDGSDWHYYRSADAQFSVRQLVDESGSLALTRTLRLFLAQAYDPKRPYTLNPDLSLIFLGPLVATSGGHRWWCWSVAAQGEKAVRSHLAAGWLFLDYRLDRLWWAIG